MKPLDDDARVRNSGRTAGLAFLLAGVGIGFALGAIAFPARDAPLVVPPSPEPNPIPNPNPIPTPSPIRTPTPSPIPILIPIPSPTPTRDPAELRARLAKVELELAQLARALADPAAVESPRAVIDDLAAFDDAEARAAEVAQELGQKPPAAPPIPSGLRSRARAIERSGLRLTVVGAPPDVEYLPAASLLRLPGPASRAIGVALAPAPGGARVAFRITRGGVERRVLIVEDAKNGHDVLSIEFGDPESSTLVRRESILGPRGSTWRALAERLWQDGTIEHRALEELVARPLARPPRAGFVDWLRRQLDLPRNRDLGEDYGPPPPLPRQNPLLLRDPRRRAAILERADLVMDPARSDPPVSVRGPGPLVLIAQNGVAIFDSAWRWLVFDPVRRRVVDHAEIEAGAVEHVAWEFFPEPERFPTARRGDLIDALCAQALERTRQTIAIVALPGELAELALELRRKVGGMLSRDGLDALRLRNEIIAREKRLDALAHLLLDDEGITTYERGLERAKLETTQAVIEVVTRMIEAGRDGPVEYLLQDEAVKFLFFHAPVTREDRDRIRRMFRERFRPFGTRVSRAITGQPSHWYDEDE